MLRPPGDPGGPGPARAGHDAIVVGGGVLGQAVAHELARDGGIDFLHIYPPGYGRDCATSAAGAMISAFGEVTESGADPLAERKLEFRVRSQDAYPEWLDGIREASGSPLPVSAGLFMIANAHGRADRRNLTRLIAALDRHGRSWQHVAPEDMPGFAPEPAYRPVGAVFIAGDFCLDSVALLDALAASVARARRGRTLHGRVRAIRPLAGDLWEVTTEQGDRHRARELILCAGAHIPEILGPDLLSRLALPSLYFAKGIGFVVSGAPAVPHAIRTPNRSDACGVHIVPRADGRLYIGASTHYGHATAAARGVTPGEVTAILGDTLRQIDARLRDATIDEVRFGLRPIAEGGAPLIGRTALAGLSLATGTFRTGIVMAPLIARLVGDQILGRAAGSDNPWPVPPATATAPASDNRALYHLNLGLRAYQDFRLRGAADRRGAALGHWRDYRAIAGDEADPRVLALVEEIGGETAPAAPARPAACL